MQKLSSTESDQKVIAFIETLKKGIKKADTVVEYFELTLHEPFFERLNCAYVQTANKKEWVLYEGLTNRFFLLSVNKAATPSLVSLTKSVGMLFPKSVKDKMFWVCGNKKDKKLEIGDFGVQFTLSKPKI